MELKERFLNFGVLGYFSYFQMGKFLCISFCIGPSTWGRSKWTWMRHSKQHWCGLNDGVPPDYIRTLKLPFNIHMIAIDFGETKLPFAVDIHFTGKD